ncbi:MAG: hypothetical protein WD066_10875 [Planctomycetaceae bacterium]
MSYESRHAIPPEVAAVLVRLRRSIRRYVLLEGTAIVLVVLGVLFWLSLGLDALWFQLNRLELPRWFRAAFLVAGFACVAAAFCLWIAMRMFRRFRLKALALVIERRFPEFDDRLITAVEAADDTTGRESELTRAMLDRTVRQAADEARGIDVGAVFERRPLRRALIAAVVLVVGIGAFAATNAHAMNRWWRAYFALHEEYWERSYHLEVFTVTPPDDRVRRLDSSIVHLHPKGGAFVPLIIVPDSQVRLRALAGRQQELRAATERLSAAAGDASAESTDSADSTQLLADQKTLAERLVAERAELRLPPGGLDDAPRAVEAIEKHDWPAALAAQKSLAETLTAYAAAVEPWKIPDRVEFKYHIAGQNRTRPVHCTRVTDQALLDQHQALAIFRHSLSELIGDLTFSVYGGDYTNREPYEVRVVDPPRIVQPTLHCDFPPHAIPPSTAPRVRNTPGVPVAVHGGQIAIPVETRFLLECRCNKPLTAVRIEFADRTIELRVERPAVSDDLMELESGLNWRTSGRVIRQPADGGRREIRELTASEAARWLPPGSDTFQVPFALSEGATEPARARIAADLFDFGPPVVLSPGTRLRIHLTDGDEIASVQPELLEIVGVSDEPPRMADIRLRGIGNMITRRAVIPFTGTITDDNGLAKARFEFQVDDGESGQQREFRRPPVKLPREFKLSRSDDEEFERFDVLPLELAEGQVLRLNVYAADADLLNGPGVTRSERIPFQIVSDEDLLALLYGRELNLRLRFEQIIRELEITRDRLAQQRDVNLPELESLRAQSEPTTEIEARIRALVNGRGAAADQSKHDVDKNQNESRGVEIGFREILEELDNNRIQYHSANELERIHDQIVKPLEEINLRGFLEVDRAIGILRLANDRGTDPLPGMNNSIDSLDRLIQDMNKVLETMKAFVGIHEMIQELTAIIVDGENIRETIVKEQRRKLIEDFGTP